MQIFTSTPFGAENQTLGKIVQSGGVSKSTTETHISTHIVFHGHSHSLCKGALI